MADIIDKAILFGMGLEKRLKGLIDEVVEEGRGKEGEVEEGAQLPPRQELENRLAEEGVHLIREIIATARGGKERVEKEIQEIVERFLDRCMFATKDDIEVIQKMAQVAREKVDSLEKKIKKLEKGPGK
jgi:BMFP domain-containing protein YqiC